MRTCKACQKEKPVEDFATYTRKGEKFPLKTCKECYRIHERERQRKYVEANREAHNKRSRDNKRSQYHDDPEFRERLRAESKEYYETNKEFVLAERRRRYQEGIRPFPVLPPREALMSDEEEFEAALAELRGRPGVE